MRIAVDVMGGDNAPDAILAGSLDAVPLLAPDDQLVLIGDEAIIREYLVERRLTGDPRIIIDPTTEVIGMEEPPVTAVRNKPHSSIVRMAKLGGHRHAGAQRCDVIISAGNTGACVASVQMAMRRLPGVHRPGIAITMPTFHGPIVICDVGANPEPRPSHLHQYGHMSAVYCNRILGVQSPRVALLSIGGEEAKGNSMVKETAKLMRADSTLNYVGYVEGRDLFNGRAEVIITEGFTGNVVLKLAEGLASGIFRTIAHTLFEINPDLAMQFEPVIKAIYKKHDYHEYGGAPLLGANGIFLKCHGSSEARSITAAVKAAQTYARLDVNHGIVEALAKAQTAEVAEAPKEPV